ncbi:MULTISPECIES: peptidoglycan-binding protein [Brevibacterium]|uniref:peptidoglycan-binding protein n=1 Tax=Brevibacterium TaxID=1696 RepID=UPI00197BCE04|nr:peptidoglycan-binding protein [Brevibacterium casei]MCT1445876.1 peptidoglycan-binding protein [Brevibacterium casei]MCT1550100.1 peptidoglycan-binding protein [Brevibacterium casei]MCT1559642.1 peptidoglycan-binding protein [Brevibacterium casei]MCT1765571.1 peptidoglycan-binding protein [Brevibacterium casei]MCT2181776.1 peptidoglycan-binding protein [Brevibacterium casei]
MPRQTRHRRGPRSVLVGALIGLGAAVAALAIGAVVILNSPVSFGSTTIRQMQMASVNQLNQQQIDNARLIIAVGRGGGFDDEAIRIALMTALQESSLRNISHGDRDSVGLFQQRPSQGWGDPSELTDPVFATKSFYGINPEIENPGLNQIENWDSMTPTEAAQAVQRSAYPNAYGQWESLADDLIGSQDDVEALH